MNEEPNNRFTAVAIVAVIGIAVLIHSRKASPQKEDIAAPKSKVAMQAHLERQLEARINWDVAKRIESGEFKTEAEVIYSIASRWPYAEGESRLELDEQLQAVVSWPAVEKALTNGEKKPTAEEIQAEQMRRWTDLLKKRAIEGDPTIEQ